MRQGYGFYWFPFGLPFLACPDGRHIQLSLDNYVPRLPSWLETASPTLGVREVLVPWSDPVVVPVRAEAETSGGDEVAPPEGGSGTDETEGDENGGNATPRGEEDMVRDEVREPDLAVACFARDKFCHLSSWASPMR